MTRKASSRRWLATGFLVALGLVLLLALPGCGGEDAAEDHAASEQETAESKESASGAGTPGGAGDDGPAVRRVTEGCNPAETTAQYEALVGKRALAILQWTGMPARTANLRIPINLVSITNDELSVRFLQFPMREQYLNIWIGSGHIRPGSNDLFLLDPCSAIIVEWPAMERE